jgi:hypothetical protein
LSRCNVSRSHLFAALLSLAAATQLPGASPAQAAAPAAAATGQGESAKYARELLDSMARFVAGLPGLQVQLVGSYDAVQASGRKIEFGEVRSLALARPDRLRVEQLRSDGSADLLVFDGRLMSVFDGSAGVYAQAPQPEWLDDALVYFVRDLGMQLPLAAMLSTRFPDEMARRAQALEYVEYTEILPVPAHHIAGQTSAVDFQVWIADGDRPVPLRIVLTYRDEPGQPQFRVQFVNWRTDVPTDAGLFAFTAPEGARQIAWAVQVPHIVGQSGAADPAPTGGRP